MKKFVLNTILRPN